MSKGSHRRREDRERVEANWDRIFGARQAASEVSKISESGSYPDAPANCDDCKAVVYIDNCSGAQVHEDWWPGDPVGYPSNG